jgi:trehalose 6-phosphate synthase
VLILSQFAGAAEELTEAIVINPHDADTIAEALHKALVMPLEERRERYEALYAKVVRTSAKAFCDKFLGALRAMPARVNEYGTVAQCELFATDAFAN